MSASRKAGTLKTKLAGPGAASVEARKVMDAIRRLVRALRVASRQAERQVGLSSAQLFVLHKLADGATPSLNELAERTLTHQSSVSVVVQRLVERRLVRRVRSENDARRVELSLSARGRAVLKKAPGTAQDRLIRSIESLAPGDRRRVANALTLLVAAAGLDDQTPAFMFEEESARRSKY